jgi:hypothetical protein
MDASSSQPKTRQRLTRRLVVGILAFAQIFWLALPNVAYLATIFLSPATGKVVPGQTFSLTVYVSSPDESVNAFSGAISYDSSLVEVTSLSKSGSIISLWVQEPSFSNGTVRFEGIRFNPGFQGSNGKILSITARAKAAGEATFSFIQASALANDGQGTQKISGTGRAKFTIAVGEEKPVEKPVEKPTTPTELPAAPKLVSSSHPNSQLWYREKHAVVSWTLPSDVTGVNYAIDRTAETIPETVSRGTVRQFERDIYQDGQWYAHVRFLNAKGWGVTGHYRIQVDTVAPTDIKLEAVAPTDPASVREAFRVLAQDTSSGIEKIEIKVGDGDYRALANPNETYVLPQGYQAPLSLNVRATDRAGNVAEQAFSWPITPAVSAQLITEYDVTLPQEGWMVVKGTAPANARVIVTRQRIPGEAMEDIVVADEQGEWTSAVRATRRGLYMVTAAISPGSDQRGQASPAVFVRVRQPIVWALDVYFIQWGWWKLFVGLICLAFLAWFIRRRKQRGRPSSPSNIRKRKIERPRSSE